jgi:hypothetical protein
MASQLVRSLQHRFHTDTNRSPEDLDDLLASYSGRSLADWLQADTPQQASNQRLPVVINGWVPGKDRRHTWLTEAVQNQKMEFIAILLFYDADPNKACPLRSNFTAFDDCWAHRHAQNRDRFYFLATLLNNGRNPYPRPFGSMMHNDHLVGQDPDAPLLVFNRETRQEEIPAEYDTALTFAVKHNLPFCVRWLVDGRGADISVKNGNGLAPLEVAMQCLPEPPRTPSDSWIIHENYEVNLGRWKEMVITLERADTRSVIVNENNLKRWKRQYPEAFRFFYGIMLSRIRY